MGGTIPPFLKALVLFDSCHFCSYSIGNNYSDSHLDRRDAGKRMLGNVAPWQGRHHFCYTTIPYSVLPLSPLHFFHSIASDLVQAFSVPSLVSFYYQLRYHFPWETYPDRLGILVPCSHNTLYYPVIADSVSTIVTMMADYLSFPLQTVKNYGGRHIVCLVHSRIPITWYINKDVLK